MTFFFHVTGSQKQAIRVRQTPQFDPTKVPQILPTCVQKYTVKLTQIGIKKGEGGRMEAEGGRRDEGRGKRKQQPGAAISSQEQPGGQWSPLGGDSMASFHGNRP